jgi:hypothetical protein
MGDFLVDGRPLPKFFQRSTRFAEQMDGRSGRRKPKHLFCSWLFLGGTRKIREALSSKARQLTREQERSEGKKARGFVDSTKSDILA